MSVSNGQVANQDTFNGAFLSRITDSDTIGKIDLKNDDSAEVIDLQGTINDTLARVDTAESDIDALEASRVIKAASSTDNGIARFDGTTGQQLQNSGVTIDDSDNINVPGDLVVQGNLTVNGTTTSIDSANLEVEDQNITVNKGGTDISADGAGLTVERTGTDGSMIYDQTAISKWKAGDVGSEKEVVTISDAQIITNKDIDGGTASNTNRMTAPKGALATLLALTRKEGTYVYATDTQKLYYDDGTTLVDPSGGATSAIDTSAGTGDAGKIVKTGADGYLDKTFVVAINSFATEAAFVTYLGRAAANGDSFFDTTINEIKTYKSGTWYYSSAAGIPLIETTGVIKDYLGTSAPTGYVFGSGRTIGSAASGSTERANADTANLYSLLWDSYSNTILAIQDSAGVATTRGANAAADFAANKRLPLPDLRGRVLPGKDDMGGTSANRITVAGCGVDGDVLGNSGGAETHSLTANENGTHTHTQNSHTHTVGQASAANPGTSWREGVSSDQGNGTSGSTTAVNQNSGLGTAHNNVQPIWVVNKIIAL